MNAINGTLSPGFEAVGQAFEELFTDWSEMGGSVSLIHHGETVVDLWAGSRDRGAQAPWQHSTRSNIFSASKAVTAVAILQLIERGQLLLDAPIADVWPEFGGQGKAAITVRQVLCHRSGMNAFHAPVADHIIYDWAAVTEQVAQEEPWWIPDSQQGYSPMLFGWVLGEVVRRVSGSLSFDDYVQRNICQPLGIELKFGLDDSELNTVADVVMMRTAQKNVDGSLVDVIRANPRGVTNRAFSNPPSLQGGTNKAAWRQAQIPAANGQASALDLALFYSSLVDLDDERLLSAASRPWCWQEQSCEHDAVLNQMLSFSLGFMRLLPAGIESEGYFCHPGAGGSLGYADTKEGFGFGYVSRVMGQAVLLDERADHLLQSVYAVLRGKV